MTYDPAGKRPVGDLDLARRQTDFDPLHAQDVHQLGDAGHVALDGNHERVRRFRLPRLDRVLRLAIEVVDDEVGERRRELERAQNARLHVVGVVPAREVVRRAGWNRNPAIPLACLTTAAPGRRSGRGAATTLPASPALGSWRRFGSVTASVAAAAATGSTSALSPSLASSLCLSPFSPRSPATSRRRVAAPGRRRRVPARTAAPGRRARPALAAGLRFIHAHHAVVVVRDRAEVTWRPAVHERVRVDARHAPLGHLRQLEVREPRELGEEDGIEIGVLRCGAAVGVEQRERLVQVVHDRRMRGEVPVGDGAHGFLRQVDVAVVVVVDVLAPVRHGRAATSAASTSATPALAWSRLGAACWRARTAAGGGLLFLRSIEPVDVTVAAVGIGLRRHRHDDVLADLLDERRGFGGQAVHQFHQHLGWPGLAAVQAAHEVIVRLRRRDELGDLRLGQPARVGNLRQVVAVLLQALDVLVRRDPDDDQLAVLVGLADRFDPDAWRGGGERAVVLQRIGVVGELAGRADVITEHVLGRRHARHLWQVIDERADEVRLRRPLLDELGEVFVLRLSGITRFGDHLLSRHRNAGEQQRRSDDERDAPIPRGVRDRHCRNSLSLLEGRGDSIRGRVRVVRRRRGRR